MCTANRLPLGQGTPEAQQQQQNFFFYLVCRVVDRSNMEIPEASHYSVPKVIRYSHYSGSLRTHFFLSLPHLTPNTSFFLILNKIIFLLSIIAYCCRCRRCILFLHHTSLFLQPPVCIFQQHFMCFVLFYFFIALCVFFFLSFFPF